MNNLLFSQSVFLIGLILLGAGIYAYFRRRRQIATWTKTQGTVVELLRFRKSGEYVVKKSTDGLKVEPKYMYRPVIEFRTDNGKKIRVRASVASRPKALDIGDAVEVIFDPANPESAQINRSLYLWFAVMMLLGFGIFSIGMGLLGIWLQGIF